MPKRTKLHELILGALPPGGEMFFGVLESKVRGSNQYPRMVDKPSHEQILRAVNTLAKQGHIQIQKSGVSSYRWTILAPRHMADPPKITQKTETVMHAAARLSDLELSGDDMLSRLIMKMIADIKTLPDGAEIHGASITVVTTSGEGLLRIKALSDVWSMGGANALIDGLGMEHDRLIDALKFTDDIAEA